MYHCFDPTPLSRSTLRKFFSVIFLFIILYIYFRICACIVHILQLINLILLRMCSWFWCCNYRFSFTRACEVGLGFRVCGFIQFCSLLLSLTRVYLDLFVFSFIFSSSNSFADLNPCLFFFLFDCWCPLHSCWFWKKKGWWEFWLCVCLCIVLVIWFERMLEYFRRSWLMARWCWDKILAWLN